MGEKTAIEWTATVLPDGQRMAGATFNPWRGCQKVSAGCANCYAEAQAKRFGYEDAWGPKGKRRKTTAENWKKPRKWNIEAAQAGVRIKVFCASLADVFEPRSELVSWREELFEMIIDTPHLDWLLLTKRPELIRQQLGVLRWKQTHDPMFPRGATLPGNVWLGTSVESQAVHEARVEALLDVPARVHFLSCEPLLGPLDLRLKQYPVSWVICGGESGSGYRPMAIEWARSLRDQCAVAGVPFFMKQPAGPQPGRYDCLPDDLKVQEWPIPKGV